MKALPNSIKDEFENQGHWVLSKTNNLFSSIPLDQAHEQENAYVKSSSGCIGLTENPCNSIQALDAIRIRAGSVAAAI